MASWSDEVHRLLGEIADRLDGGGAPSSSPASGAGDASDKGAEASGPPKITRFVGQPLDPIKRKPTADLAERIVMAGHVVRFEWTVEGAGTRLELQGATKMDVQGHSQRSGATTTGSVELNPAEFLPDAKNQYRLVFASDSASASATVGVVGILAVVVAIRDPKATGKDFALFERDGETKVGEIRGRPGSYRAVPYGPKQDPVFFGQITPHQKTVGAPVQFSWRVCLDPGWGVFLDHNPADLSRKKAPDGTSVHEEAVTTATDGKGTADRDDVTTFAVYFEADLVVREKAGDKTSKEVTRAFFLLRENHPFPELTGFELWDRRAQPNPVPVPAGGSIIDFGRLEVRFRLKHAVRNHLTLLIHRVEKDGKRTEVERKVLDNLIQGDAEHAASFSFGYDASAPNKHDGQSLEATLTLTNDAGQPSNLGLKAKRTIPFSVTSQFTMPAYKVNLPVALSQANGSMLHHAAGTLTREDATPTIVAADKGKPASGAIPEQNPIWSWTFEIGEAKDVKCRVHSNDYSLDMVAEKIVWHDVWVVRAAATDELRKKIQLPIEQRFVLWKFKHEGGEITENHATGHYWKLPTSLDQSAMLVLGYVIDKDGGVGPFDIEPTKDFLPLCPAPAPQDQESRPAGQAIKPEEPIRIIVCLTLGCGKMRADFEPGRVNYAGRLWPMIHIIASQDLARAHGGIKVVRPATSGHECCQGEQPEMHTKILPIMFTDTNGRSRMRELFIGGADKLAELAGTIGEDIDWYDNPATLLRVAPYWGNFFDYYQAPSTERPFKPLSFTAVDHARAGTEQPMVDRLCEFVTDSPIYKSFPVTKEPGQGAFDSVHLAPLMQLPPGHRTYNTAKFAKSAITGQSPAPAEWGLVDIAMAPYCIHDCLHTHWRWGTTLSGFNPHAWPTWGWDGFDPHVKPGLPLVPQNQRVVVHLLDERTLDSEIFAYRVDAGRWQVMGHNGYGYALMLQPSADKMLPVLLTSFGNIFQEPKVDKDPAITPPPTKPWYGDGLAYMYWSFRYWRLRYGGSLDRPMERVRFTDAELEQLKDYRVFSFDSMYRDDWDST